MRSAPCSRRLLAVARWLVGGAGAEDDASRRLVAAVARGDAAEVAALLRQGADPDAADRSGWTGPAPGRGDGRPRAAPALLLEAGAPPDLRSRARGTPLDVAERAGRDEMARLLRAHGARGSGKSIGDTVCVRPWRGDGYCGVVEAVDPTRFRSACRGSSAARGCAPKPPARPDRPSARAASPGDVLWVPASCLTTRGWSGERSRRRTRPLAACALLALVALRAAAVAGSPSSPTPTATPPPGGAGFTYNGITARVLVARRVRRPGRHRRPARPRRRPARAGPACS